MRKPDLENDKKVLALRKKKLTFRQIARLLDKDVKNVYVSYKRAVGVIHR